MGIFEDLDIHKILKETKCDIMDLINIIEEKLESFQKEEFELNGDRTSNVKVDTLDNKLLGAQSNTKVDNFNMFSIGGGKNHPPK